MIADQFRDAEDRALDIGIFIRRGDRQIALDGLQRRERGRRSGRGDGEHGYRSPQDENKRRSFDVSARRDDDLDPIIHDGNFVDQSGPKSHANR